MFALVIVLAFLSAAASPAPPAASLPPLTADQSAAYERGQSYERVILANEDRRWYGIALLHPVFAADLDAFSSGKDFAPDTSFSGPLRTYLESGDQAALPASFSDANSFDPYLDSSPKDGATWWYAEAGLADSEIRGAGGDQGLEMLAAGHAAWLRDHASLGGPYATALGLGASDGSQPDLMSLEPKIETLFERSAPAKPIFAVVYGKGPMSYARLGISMATVAEMIDSPSLLAQPGSQTFVAAFAQQMGVVSNGSLGASKILEFEKALVVDAKFDHDGALDTALQSTSPALHGLTQADKRCFSLGMVAAQAAYNAFSLKDPNAAGQQLGAIGAFADLDASDAAIHDLRVKMTSIPGGDWASVIKLGRALVDEIETHP
jgi:hypothetical protein